MRTEAEIRSRIREHQRFKGQCEKLMTQNPERLIGAAIGWSLAANQIEELEFVLGEKD